MKKRTMSLAASALAMGLVLAGSVPASATTTASVGTLHCSVGWVGVYGNGTGWATFTINNGPSQWGKTWPYSEGPRTHHLAAPTHWSSSMYVSFGTKLTAGTYGKTCYSYVGSS